MSDLEAAEKIWGPWIQRACAAVDVDPAHVDVPTIHALTKDIAHTVARPMAPVGSFILGLAIGQTLSASSAEAERLLALLRATVPLDSAEATS